MSIVEQILKVRDSQVGWFDGYELRKIAEEVHKLEEISEVRLAYIGQLEAEKEAANQRIKRLEEAGDAMACCSDEDLAYLWRAAREANP